MDPGEMIGVPAPGSDERAVEILMEEMRGHAGDIRNRVELQHKNFNVFIVLTTALTGYLVNYWNDHGLQRGGDALLHSEIVLLILLIPLFACVFAWRHADHDANIIDDAAYVEMTINPKLRRYAADQELLRWEEFLRQRRVRRMRRVGPVSMFATEPVIMALIAALYLFAGWYLRIDHTAHAGEAEHWFNVLLYVDTFLFAISVYVGAATAFWGYSELGSPGKQGAPDAGHSKAPAPKA
jgi:hypothetical protein